MQGTWNTRETGASLMTRSHGRKTALLSAEMQGTFVF